MRAPLVTFVWLLQLQRSRHSKFYDHAENDTVWGRNLVYTLYADEKTVYPLASWLYDDDDDRTKYELAREIISGLEEEVGLPADAYLMDSWFTHDSNLIECIKSYDNDWIGPLRSNQQVTYGGEEIRVDALCQHIDKTEREMDDAECFDGAANQCTYLDRPEAATAPESVPSPTE